MPLLEVSGLSKSYFRGRSGRNAHRVDAVRDVTLHLDAGEILGLVGESGSGKTTTARCIAGLVRPTAGSILFEGKDVLALRATELRAARRPIKMIFQNPYSSLDPRMSVGEIVAEGVVVNKLATGREDWLKLWERLPADPTDEEIRRNFPIRQPVLWVDIP